MPRFEYWHGTLDAQDSRAEPYPYQEIADYLTLRGEEGWELVHMTPDWVWGYNSIEQKHEYDPSDFAQGSGQYVVNAPYSIPRYVTRWYCTFKRQID